MVSFNESLGIFFLAIAQVPALVSQVLCDGRDGAVFYGEVLITDDWSSVLAKMVSVGKENQFNGLEFANPSAIFGGHKVQSLGGFLVADLKAQVHWQLPPLGRSLPNVSESMMPYV